MKSSNLGKFIELWLAYVVDDEITPRNVIDDFLNSIPHLHPLTGKLLSGDIVLTDKTRNETYEGENQRTSVCIFLAAWWKAQIVYEMHMEDVSIDTKPLLALQVPPVFLEALKQGEQWYNEECERIRNIALAADEAADRASLEATSEN